MEIQELTQEEMEALKGGVWIILMVNGYGLKSVKIR